MRQPLSFTFGGPHEVSVRIGLAGQIERATGLGVMVLAEQARRMTLPVHHATEIVRLAIVADGAKMTPAKALEATDKAGIIETLTLAALILNQLFLPADTPAAKRGKSAKPADEDADPLAASH